MGSIYTEKADNKKIEEILEYQAQTSEAVIEMAAKNWDYDDSLCLNYDAKSRLVETFRDLIKIIEIDNGNETVLEKNYVQLYADKEEEARGF